MGFQKSENLPGQKANRLTLGEMFQHSSCPGSLPTVYQKKTSHSYSEGLVPDCNAASTLVLAERCGLSQEPWLSCIIEIRFARPPPKPTKATIEMEARSSHTAIRQSICSRKSYRFAFIWQAVVNRNRYSEITNGPGSWLKSGSTTRSALTVEVK